MNKKIPKTLPFWHPAFLIATWFGSGLLPKIPGTWGSAAALPFAWLIMWLGGPWALLICAGVAFAVGVWAAGMYSKHSGIKDAGPIVIDEVAGQWLTLIPAGLNPVLFLVGFFLFRAADILKPWPASWADREVEGGFGVMLDDIFAAIYAAAGLYGFIWYFEWPTTF
ncbi:MAG: phosphatidylglycerophosphatase A [Alphaproteobacteria bacterium]|nr:phosphatidylglycerophosphatase A [Alphaproteobacteria bacterium]